MRLESERASRVFIYSIYTFLAADIRTSVIFVVQRESTNTLPYVCVFVGFRLVCSARVWNSGGGRDGHGDANGRPISICKCLLHSFARALRVGHHSATQRRLIQLINSPEVFQHCQMTHGARHDDHTYNAASAVHRLPSEGFCPINCLHISCAPPHWLNIRTMHATWV